MKKAIIAKKTEIITRNAEVADSFFKRFRGLMFRKRIEKDYALYITPCNQIHTFNMRFPIDVIYISESGGVVEIHKNVKPNKICKTVKNAEGVIEVNALMTSEWGIVKGDSLRIVRDLNEKG